MSRIERRFAELITAGRTALIPFITAGDPSAEVTLNLMHTVVGAGADLLELGIPFSDPMAEGPVIQRACERALANGATLEAVFESVAKFRQSDIDTPVILMGYLNPIEAWGYAAFTTRAEEAGVDGFIIVDLPPEEAEGLLAETRPKGLDMIFLTAPTSSAQRLEKISKAASGFVYYVSLKGVTGAGNLDAVEVANKVNEIRKYTDLPIGVGFGIKDGASAAAVGQVADAVVVGSAVVSRIEEHQDDPDAMRESVRRLLTEIRTALDA